MIAENSYKALFQKGSIHYQLPLDPNFPIVVPKLNQDGTIELVEADTFELLENIKIFADYFNKILQYWIDTNGKIPQRYLWGFKNTICVQFQINFDYYHLLYQMAVELNLVPEIAEET